MTAALSRMRAHLHGPIGYVLYGLAVFVMLLGQWQPLTFTPHSPEPWIIVLSEAGAGRYRFGTDVVFTMGPLSDAYSRFFNPATFGRMLVAIYAFVAITAVSFTILAVRAGSLTFPVLLLCALYFIISRDVLLMIIPLLAALIGLERPTERLSIVVSMAGAALAAVATLAKFSLFPLSIGVFLLVDLNRLRLRRPPLTVASYGVTLYLAFQVLTARGSDFIAYLKGSFEASSGYSAAMALVGPWTDYALYGALLTAAVIALFVAERRRTAAGGVFGWEAAGQLLATLLFLWITFKIGFVRHDLHVLSAFAGLSLAIAAYGLVRVGPFGRGRIVTAIFAIAVIVPGFFVHYRLAGDPALRSGLDVTLRDAALAAPREIRRTAHAIVDLNAWRAGRMEERRLGLGAMAGVSPVSSLDGSVESLSDIHSSLIAAGLDYRPKPTIQAYATYTKPLIDRNRAFFADRSGPEYVLFDPTTMDDRYPSLVEAASWPTFLSSFSPQQMTGEGVMLRRRREPLGDVLSDETRGQARMGAPLPIDFASDPLFVSLDIRPTLLGRIVNFLFKPPFVYLGVTLANGPEQIYRLIPAIAREGFLASPLVKTGRDYLILARGGPAESLAPVKTMRVFTDFGGDLAYFQQIAYSVRRVDRARLAANRDWALTPEQVAAFERAQEFQSIIARSGGANPGFRSIAEGLFAHAPRRFAVKTNDATHLKIGFGMLRLSWAQGSTDGVCFRVLEGDGSKAIWERCLDPLRSEPDRANLLETIALPAGTEQVVLETDCRGGCGWDWSYWSEIAPQRQ